MRSSQCRRLCTNKVLQYSSSHMSNLVDLLIQRAKNQPHKVAYTFLQDGETKEITLTYQELDHRARAIAAYLQTFCKPRARALLLYPSGLEFIEAFFGCLYAGVVAVPAYPPRRNQNMHRLQAILKDVQATFVLTTKSFLSDIEIKLSENLELTSLHYIATDAIPTERLDSWQELELTSDTLAFLQYTSGSTGDPKGVMITHGNIIYNSKAINQCFEDTPESQGVSWLPPYHDMGLIGGILQPLYVGASMVLISPVDFLQKPIRWLQAISRYGGTTSGGPNFAYDLCANRISPEQKSTLDLSAWKVAFNGAEPIRAETLQRFSEAFAECGFRPAAFYPCYGMAETTLIVSGGIPSREPVIRHVKAEALEQNHITLLETPQPGSRTLVGCGHTILDQDIIIVDPKAQVQRPSGRVGEIWVAGRTVAQGYWNREVESQATFAAYLSDTRQGPYLRTGDLGFLDSEGELFVTGRLKEIILIRGRNYYPQDIERIAEKSCPALRANSGAAFSVEINGRERLIITHEVERSYLRKLNVAEIARAIRRAVSEEFGLQVHTILLLKTNSLLKTSSGKIQRRVCRQAFLNGTLNVVGDDQLGSLPNSQQVVSQLHIDNLLNSAAKADQLAPSVAIIRQWLVAQLADRLELDPTQIDVNKPLAEYGLNSATAVGISGELQEWLGRSLPVTLLYDYPTIAALSQFLSAPKIGASPKFTQPSSVSRSNEPIAIIGAGCRLPGRVENAEEFWRLLNDTEDAITTVPPERWAMEPHPSTTHYGAFLEQVAEFDAAFFGISPREAMSLDPQHRLLLEVSWEAIEDAAQAPSALLGSATGVFIGISTHDYARLLESAGEVGPYFGTGNAFSTAAGRLSYTLGLTGPSLAIDTACSSSLAAVHAACQSLRLGECEQALVGGVNLILTPENSLVFSQAQMLAADGRCKVFDAAADGYVRGEGCGVVLLKPLSDALRDGDPIQAVIRGSAVNQDGRSNGLTAPSGLAQQQVIRSALMASGVAAAEIDYVETHGTGTSLGDPIELGALQEAMRVGRPFDSPIWVGSVKTNIGHLEAASGIAGLIKVVQALKHRVIPAHLHLQQPTPHFDWVGLQVATQLRAWPENKSGLRKAGVSSFGFSGTNVHVILEEAPASVAVSRNQIVERPLHLLSLSATTPAALEALCKRFHHKIVGSPELDLADLCFSANTGRNQFAQRLAVVATSTAELMERLGRFVRKEETVGVIWGQGAEPEPEAAFLFTGQGSQYLGMGRRLYETQPTFRDALDKCVEILTPYLNTSLLDALYPSEGADSPLDQTAYTQPALFALEYALYQLWRSWGVKPTAVLGHSVGEYVAACVAGVFSLEDGLKLIAARGRLMQQLPAGGVMVSLMASVEQVREAVSGRPEVAIAAINGPRSTVISGPEADVQAVAAQLQAIGVKHKPLQVSHAFHSPLLQPMIAEFEQVARQVNYSPPQLKLISNVTGRIATAEVATPDYWCRHILSPVNFAAGIETLRQQGYDVFLECGAQPILLGMGRQCLPKEVGLWLPSLRPGREDWRQMLASLGELYVRGVKVDWQGFDKDYLQRRKVSLPTYPFQRQRYWIDSPGRLSVFESTPSSLDLSLSGNLYEIAWEESPLPPLADSLNADRWLIFLDQQGIGTALVNRLRSHDAVITTVQKGETFKGLGGERFSLNPAEPENFLTLLTEGVAQPERGRWQVVYLWALDQGPEKIEQVAESGAGLLHLVQALVARGADISAQMWVVTQNTQAVAASSDFPTPMQAPLWGLGNVIALEHPELWGGLADLPETLATDVDSIANGLLAHFTTPEAEQRVAFRQGRRWGARLQPLKSASPEITSAKRPTVNSDGSYLITGGLGALGLQVAQSLIRQGAKTLVLVSRRGERPERRSTLTAMRQAGVTVHVEAVDVADAEKVASLIDYIQNTLPPLRGVVHAAGILADGLVIGQTWGQFQTVMQPKVEGAWNLHCAVKGIPLDFFVLFSSSASLLGSPGQGNYAAANAFLDTLGHARRQLGLPSLTLNWGPWRGEGMANQQQKTLQGLNARGIQSFSPEQGIRLFEQVLSRNGTLPPQVGVLEVDWSMLLPQLPTDSLPAFFKSVAGTVALKPKANILKTLSGLSAPERVSSLQSYLQIEVARILGQSDVIPITKSFVDIGLDSLMAMELLGICKRDLGLILYPREVFEHPTVETLSHYLAQELERTTSGATAPVTVTAASSSQPSVVEFAAPMLGHNRTFSPVARKNAKAIFLLSSPRSGSTLLRVMLAGHPALFCPPELHLLPFETLAERQTALAESYLNEGLQRAVMELRGLDADASQALLNDWTEQGMTVPEVYHELQTLAGDRCLVDKSPTYSFSLSTLRRAEQVFEDAKYIHLARHPYAVIDSFVQNRMDKIFDFPDKDPYHLAHQVWAVNNQNILDFLADVDPSRHYFLRYEDLVTDTEGVMGKLCDFLGVSFHPWVLNPYSHQQRRMTDGVKAYSMPIDDPNFHRRRTIDPTLADAWKSVKLPLQMPPLSRALAQEMRYELPGESPPEVNPPTLPNTPPLATMQEHWIKVRGLDFCVCTWGPKTGRSILCLHGVLDQGAIWDAIAPTLVQHGYHVIAPDLRGHGKSAHVGPDGNYQVLDHLGDVDALIQQLGLETFPVVGHSMGAMIAASLASARPGQIQSLTLVEHIVPGDEAKSTADQLTTHLNYLSTPPSHSIYVTLADAVDRFQKLIPALTPARARKLVARIVEPVNGGLRWRWDPRLLTRCGLSGGMFTRTLYAQLLQHIQASTTLIFGRQSDLNRPEDLDFQRQHLPQASVVTIMGGHNLPLESPAEVTSALLRQLGHV